MSINHLTAVYLEYAHKVRNYRLLFGNPSFTKTEKFFYNKVNQQVAYFKPGEIFCLDLFNRNEYGSTYWSLYVLRSLQPGKKGLVVPRVSPAVQVLIEAKGKKKAGKAIKFIEKLQNEHNPQQVSDKDYRIYNAELNGKGVALPQIINTATSRRK